MEQDDTFHLNPIICMHSSWTHPPFSSIPTAKVPPEPCKATDSPVNEEANIPELAKAGIQYSLTFRHFAQKVF
jgi:hypothetical protein